MVSIPDKNRNASPKQILSVEEGRAIPAINLLIDTKFPHLDHSSRFKALLYSAIMQLRPCNFEYEKDFATRVSLESDWRVMKEWYMMQDQENPERFTEFINMLCRQEIDFQELQKFPEFHESFRALAVLALKHTAFLCCVERL